jgi:hypothetical protein
MPDSTSPPSKWLSWPTVTYFLPHKMEAYADELLILGAWDNAVRQEAPKFPDKIFTIRKRFLRGFKNPAGYRTAKKKERSAFLKLIQEIFEVKCKVFFLLKLITIVAGTAGKWKDMVNCEDSTWRFLYAITSGKYKGEEEGTKKEKLF